jgi:hypothetical protein
VSDALPQFYGFARRECKNTPARTSPSRCATLFLDVVRACVSPRYRLRVVERADRLLKTKRNEIEERFEHEILLEEVPKFALEYRGVTASKTHNHYRNPYNAKEL